MECPDKKKDFRTEAAKLGVDVHAKPNEFWTPEGTPVFMVAGSGPFVGSVDYLYLLNQHRELRAALSALAQEQAPMKAKSNEVEIGWRNGMVTAGPFIGEHAVWTPEQAEQFAEYLIASAQKARITPPGAQVAALPERPKA